MAERVYDLAIIGGGINGASIAADAAGRGLTVLMAEMGDLGGATSSASSKLIHGGLRYLEHYEFRLVREALAEREVMLARAPHIVWPLRFVLPHVDGMRPAALIRSGLFLYDHLARRQRIPGSGSIDLRHDPAGAALKQDLGHGYTYWDCWVDDARLVVLNARAAADRGARVHTRTKVARASQANGLWTLVLEDSAGIRTVAARALVNAGGPWAGNILEQLLPPAAERSRLRLVKGSHIVVPRITTTGDAYLLQSSDGRAVFALPFEGQFTLIGTTDVPFSGDPSAVAISGEEEDYLLSLANRFFRRPLRTADIVWRFAGVRPLQDDSAANPSAVSRDYKLELNAPDGGPALLTVIGGKITTSRKLSEAALEMLAPHVPGMGAAWTADTPLPGGDVNRGDWAEFEHATRARYPALDVGLLYRLMRRHGSLIGELLGEARTVADLGKHFGAGLYEREVVHFRDREWAKSPDDILWRRTKTGLHLTPQARQSVAEELTRVL